MNKTDLINAVAEQADLSKKDAPTLLMQYLEQSLVP